MEDRFLFNAVVSSYYDIDTPEKYEEHESQFYLSDVDVFCNQEIGIDYDVLFNAVKQQAKNLSEKEIGQIMQHFEDNSNSPECDFVTIKPDKILQCTGLKDKNGKLIYEGDIVKIFHVSGTMQGNLFTDVVEWNKLQCRFDTERYGVFDEDDIYEVIGNIYQNPELLEE